MPFIVMRRADLPEGLLQIEDLKPNTSQRNLIYDPPGQSGYVRPIPSSDTVATTSVAGPTVTTNATYRGLAAYLIDNVADAVSGDAITAAQANTAAATIIGRAQSGLVLALANVNTALTAAGAGVGTGLTVNGSTGVLTEVLGILAGRVYQLPAGSTVTLAGAFVTARAGSFVSDFRQILDTSAFRISNGAGDIFKFKSATFTYNGSLTATLGPADGVGPALTVYSDTGTLL